MKWFSTLVISLVFLACNPVSNKISLNGTWDFVAGANLTQSQVLKNQIRVWDTLTVPGNWDATERYADYVGAAYYRRKFRIPKNWKGSQVRLKFDAVYESSKVWLNGTLIGQHEGGYTPFEFNVSSNAVFGKENTLLVMADNSYKRGAWWAWGGISRNVNVVRNESVRLVYQHISALPDFKNGMVYFNLKYKVENNGTSACNFTIHTKVRSPKHQICQDITLDKSLQANSIQVFEKSFTKKLSQVELWHFDHPHLYHIQSSLLLGAKSVDQRSNKFGIRKLEARGEQLYLNNKVVYMNGFNRVHDHPDYGNTEPDALVQHDIADMKSLGAVFSRMMHAPLANNVLDFCDSIGYLLIEEIPVWGDDDPQAFENNPLAKLWLKEMIDRDFNHPCVVGWSVGNELRDTAHAWAEKTLTQDQFAYINSMLDYIDELDTTRLKTYVSITSYQKNADFTNEPFDKVDLLCINSYGDGVKAANKTHRKFPGKPIFLSEIGMGQIGPAPDGALSEKLVNQLNGLKSLTFVVGSSLWCYNDYRSNYKGTPASGFREWGVVNERRTPKKAYQQIKEIYKR